MVGTVPPKEVVIVRNSPNKKQLKRLLVGTVPTKNLKRLLVGTVQPKKLKRLLIGTVPTKKLKRLLERTVPPKISLLVETLPPKSEEVNKYQSIKYQASMHQVSKYQSIMY